MTKGWRYEPDRHALSARGIRSFRRFRSRGERGDGLGGDEDWFGYMVGHYDWANRPARAGKITSDMGDKVEVTWANDEVTIENKRDLYKLN